jgi:hypothetical protein
MQELDRVLRICRVLMWGRSEVRSGGCVPKWGVTRRCASTLDACPATSPPLTTTKLHPGAAYGRRAERRDPVRARLGIALHSTYVALHHYLSLVFMLPWAAYILWAV